MATQIPESEQRARLDKFLAWFEASGGSLNPQVEFKFTSERGVHLRAKTNLVKCIDHKTIILSCPHELGLSALNAWDVLPVFSNHVPAGHKRDTYDLPQRLLEEARPQAIAALWLVAQRRLGPRSWWEAYIDVLPGVSPGSGIYADAGIHGMGEVNTPLWWNADERSWVSDTNLEKGITNLEKLWDSDWSSWESDIDQWAQKHEWKVTKSDFCWALTILGSRAFPSWLVADCGLGKSGLPLLEEHDPDMILYPGMDMLNHNPETQNRWQYDNETFNLVCNDSCHAGDEIFNPYGAKSNAQFLLSYGFAIDGNPHDTVALKLLRANKQFPAPRRRSHLQPGEVVEIPSMVPPGVDLPRGLFFVRPISRHKVNDPDYPSGRRRLTRHLLGFPYALLNILAGDLEVPRERRARAERIAKGSTLMGRESPNRESHIEVYAELGQRNILAVTNLLLQMLQTQIRRLYEAEGSGGFHFVPPAATDTVKHSRWRLAHTYREGQKIVLQENRSLLTARLYAALTNERELVPLGTALDYMQRVMVDIKWIEFTSGMCAGLDLADASADSIWAAGAEEPAWALVVGVAMQFDRSQRRYFNHFLPPAESGGYWLDLLDVRYPDGDGDESQAADVENADALQSVIRNAQSKMGVTGYWAESNWGEAKVQKLARIVNRETLRISLVGREAVAASGLRSVTGLDKVDIVPIFVQ